MVTFDITLLYSTWTDGGGGHGNEIAANALCGPLLESGEPYAYVQLARNYDTGHKARC